MFVLDREDLLGSGYIRNNSLNYIIPRDVIQLCCSYFSVSVPWHFEGNNLKKLLSYKPGKILFQSSDKDTIIDNIKFTSGICPNTNGIGLVSFYLKLLSIPENISSITVYYELYCRELNVKFNNIAGFVISGFKPATAGAS